MAHTADKVAQEIVMQKLNSERGMSLVEATIILMVLAILTSVLAPSLGDYVNDARQTKAKEDVEALGTSILRMLRDTGKPFPQIAVGTDYDHDNRVDLLVSEGAIPSLTADTGTALNSTAGQYLVVAALDWDDPTSQAGVELATDHLVTNSKPYASVVFPAAGGPRPGLGWRGGYLSTNTGPDPWGNRYGCTTVWLNPGADNETTGKGTNKDTFCLTAGSDGNVDTDMDGNGTGVVVGGDDLIFVLQGNTR
jgi:type II secretory pathway pseudopilin PulG